MEQFKRVINFISSSIIIGFEMACYYLVWVGYYNSIIEFPFWRKGNWLMVAVYGVFLIFIHNVYGGLKIGYLKKLNVIFSQILAIISVNIMTYLQIALLDRGFSNPFPLLIMVIGQVLGICIWAQFFYWLYTKLFPPKKMLLVYGKRPAFSLMDKINSRDDKYKIEKIIDVNQGLERIKRALKSCDAVIIGDIPSAERNLLLKYCFSNGIRTYTLPKISDIILKHADDINLFDTPLLLSRNYGLTFDQRLFKRILDVIFSIIFIILFSPLMIVLAIMIHLYDGGDIIYKQKRLTLDGEIFELYKFRSMVMDAEKYGGARLAEQDDDRVTPIGRFLRRSRFDELPQFFNILKGEMSVVGPRPERPEIAKLYLEGIPEFDFRLKVKAGLTGYAQIYGKYNTVPYDKLKLDLTYIENFSFWLDLKLIIMTVKILFIKESTEGIDKDTKDFDN